MFITKIEQPLTRASPQGSVGQADPVTSMCRTRAGGLDVPWNSEVPGPAQGKLNLMLAGSLSPIRLA